MMRVCVGAIVYVAMRAEYRPIEIILIVAQPLPFLPRAKLGV